MYAWRARIGLIKPTHRGKSFHFWYDHAPDGVESCRPSWASAAAIARPSRTALSGSRRSPTI